jgi:tripartite-type tricarboxylate transporter receptor subunit TctC
MDGTVPVMDGAVLLESPMPNSMQVVRRARATLRTTLRCAAASLGVGLIAAGVSFAESYPSRPVKLVLQLPAGSIVDVAARLIATPLSSRLGQPVVVENRPGGGGTIAAKAVASSAADGYTLLFVGVQSVFAAVVSNSPTVDPLKEFTAVAGIVTFPWVLVVPSSVPAKSMQELVAYAKAHPRTLNWGFGQGTGPHLLGELFLAEAGIDVTRIPYKGGTQAVPDMLGGRIQMNIGTVSNLRPLVEEGKIRALAVTGETRSPELPNVPTMKEVGLPRLTLGSWTGLLAPTGTQTDIVTRLNREINAVLATPEVMASMAKLGFEPQTGSPQEFATFLADQIHIWGSAAKLAGVKPQ